MTDWQAEGGLAFARGELCPPMNYGEEGWFEYHEGWQAASQSVLPLVDRLASLIHQQRIVRADGYSCGFELGEPDNPYLPTTWAYRQWAIAFGDGKRARAKWEAGHD